MKTIVLLVMFSSFVFADAMSGWNNSEAEAKAKAQQEEQARMCELYTDKIKKYKATMRQDELAEATLNNYIRLQKKFCSAGNR